MSGFFSDHQKISLMAEFTLNARNLLCPLPVIRTQDRIKQLQTGDELTVICTDPGALADIPAWCRVHGHSIKETSESDTEVFIVIVVAQSD